MSVRRLAACVFAVAILASAVRPGDAFALNPLKPVCSAAGLFSGLVGKACSVASNGKRLLGAGKKLVTGHVGSAVKTALGDGAAGAASTATATLGLTAITVWAAGGAHFALDETAKLISATTRPQLGAAWFSRVYWRVAGIAVLLTLPFLFAAAVQALVRSDLALLLRAAFGYLPLAMLGVAVAAQLTALLLSATDALCSLVSGAAGGAGTGFLTRAAVAIGGFTLIAHSPFLAFLIAGFTVAGTVVLWIELMMRDAAVSVIVALLPLAFAALVWPARRVWAHRAVEVLVALILSKLAIVAVLTLGGAALAQTPSPIAFTTGLVLVMLGALAPWAVMRLVPVAELSASAVGRLRSELTPDRMPERLAFGLAEGGHGWAATLTARMRDDAGDVSAEAKPAEAQAQRLGDGDMAAEVAASGGDGGGEPPAGDGDHGGEPPAGDGGDGGSAPREADNGTSPPPSPCEPGAYESSSELESESEPELASGLPEEGERQPGAARQWQAPNGGWKTIVLGGDAVGGPATWSPDVLWPPEAEPLGSQLPEPAAPDPEAPGPAAGPGAPDSEAPQDGRR